MEILIKTKCRTIDEIEEAIKKLSQFNENNNVRIEIETYRDVSSTLRIHPK